MKYIYKSADQILEEGKWRKVSEETSGSGPSAAISKVKVIDMTGKEQRVLSGYHAIASQKMAPDEDDLGAEKSAVLPGNKWNFKIILFYLEFRRLVFESLLY